MASKLESPRDRPHFQPSASPLGGVSNVCPPIASNAVKSPLKNIFSGLSETELASVIAHLHQNLNLTASVNASSWDNTIAGVELLQPNKTDAAPYLDGFGEVPDRYAKVTIAFSATEEPYIEDYIVGPLPISNETSIEPLNWPCSKGHSRQRNYLPSLDVYKDYLATVSISIEDILLLMFNRTHRHAPDDTLVVDAAQPLWIDDGIVTTWNEYSTVPTDKFDDVSILQAGLAFKTNITGRDPSKWSVIGWYYNGVFYKTTEQFRKAVYTPGFEILPVNIDGEWGSTDPLGETKPHDNIPPPLPIQPQGSRFSVDTDENYVEWMDFSFFLTFTRDTGMRLYDIRYKGERIIYELGMQEAIAHYAGSHPSQSAQTFVDSCFGFAPYTFELVNGYDCPNYATYLNSKFYHKEKLETHNNNICLFEMDSGYPIGRHSAQNYVYSTKNIYFVLRSIGTLGNYDYMFDYAFYLDGSIKVTVRASGYISAAFWAHNSDYGFKIHDAISGSMHDHVINYKLDMDINGTANSLMKVDVVPATEIEDEGRINWAANAASMYSVVNKDSPNKYGEYRGYRLAPGTVHDTFL
ncbi:hypothetical protein G7Z17_g765 [Cylindrodendrum hubeiense]|uniref:Amine oxidase n=1 Tax=Cylindrodendrum hubeiense TaxID=595255 RepID=A0A9P5HG03_9HYPO|nr:hypothetical protein G7Z17_g765 [Cylindrodendrum hubeiense]